jgi:CheY-like chemotaxis protein
MSENGNEAEFVHHVQQALTGLYKPAELSHSPLIGELGLSQQPDHVAALRQVLIDAILVLKPGASVPLSSNSWRIYHILTFRYLEQSSQKQVATDLALSIRQLRRDEDEAVRVLADFLWTQHHPQNMPSPGSRSFDAQEPASQASDAASHRQDLDWLRNSFPGEFAEVLAVIRYALNTLEPVLRDAQVQLEYVPPAQPPPLVPSQPEVLRQAIINLLLAAIYSARNTTVQMVVGIEQGQVRLRVRVRMAGRGTPHNAESKGVEEALDMTRELLSIFGGSLTITPSTGSPGAVFDACMSLPTSTRTLLPILVIDDHADAQQLMQRYLYGSQYQFNGCRDPEKAMEMAVELAPRIIILDVMLPGTDGWELLGRLRHNPLTSRVPVIVSTFLPQEQMALTLGAAAFLRKPISRQPLLAALDRQVEPLLKESH